MKTPITTGTFVTLALSVVLGYAAPQRGAPPGATSPGINSMQAWAFPNPSYRQLADLEICLPGMAENAEEDRGRCKTQSPSRLSSSFPASLTVKQPLSTETRRR